MSQATMDDWNSKDFLTIMNFVCKTKTIYVSQISDSVFQDLALWSLIHGETHSLWVYSGSIVYALLIIFLVLVTRARFVDRLSLSLSLERFRQELKVKYEKDTWWRNRERRNNMPEPRRVVCTHKNTNKFKGIAFLCGPVILTTRVKDGGQRWPDVTREISPVPFGNRTTFGSSFRRTM